jgi:hypothetical protein
MKTINTFDKFVNEMYFGPGSGFDLGKKLAVIEDIAKKLSKSLDKEKEYTFEEIAKEIPEHGGVASMHTDDVKKVMAELKKDGFKMHESIVKRKS